jgi:hypothetical protein
MLHIVGIHAGLDCVGQGGLSAPVDDGPGSFNGEHVQDDQARNDQHHETRRLVNRQSQARHKRQEEGQDQRDEEQMLLRLHEEIMRPGRRTLHDDLLIAAVIVDRVEPAGKKPSQGEQASRYRRRHPYSVQIAIRRIEGPDKDPSCGEHGQHAECGMQEQYDDIEWHPVPLS